MNGNLQPNRKRSLPTLAAGLLLGGWVALTGDGARAQTVPPDLTPGLQRVVDFAKEGLSDELILATCVTNTGTACTLSAEDIVYLHNQGVSDLVIKSLILSSLNRAPAEANPLPEPNLTAPVEPVAGSTPAPPPLDASSPGLTPVVETVPSTMVSPAVTAGLLDNFFSDSALNPALWTTHSDWLTALGAAGGRTVPATLTFTTSGMRMDGIRAPGDFMGIASRAGFAAPFTFSATVTGSRMVAMPFEIFLVSADLQQWVSVAGQLGGSADDQGVWVNHTGNSLPISARGNKIFDQPAAATPYTVRIVSGANGAAQVSLLDATGTLLAVENVPVGLGPFQVVLAGRDGFTGATWQSVQVIPSAPPVVTETPVTPTVPTLDYFQAQLAPYGTWVTIPSYGRCWQPAVPTGWRPYYDGGSWADTESGWYWRSDYPWGDLTFHYGRWTYAAGGWVWVPGYDYSAAWVVWRHADAAGYIGWAPLPPGATGAGDRWRFNGNRVGADSDFGLGLNYFSFVSFDHFWATDFHRYIVPRNRLGVIYRTSVVAETGLTRDRLAAFTQQPSSPKVLADLKSQEEKAHAAARQNDLNHFLPGNKPNALRVVKADGTGN